MSIYCSRCGSQNPDDARFCFHCGARFVDVAPPRPAESGEGGASRPVVQDDGSAPQVRSETEAPAGSQPGFPQDAHSGSGSEPAGFGFPGPVTPQAFEEPVRSETAASVKPVPEVAAFGARFGAFILDFIVLMIIGKIALRIADLGPPDSFGSNTDMQQLFKEYMDLLMTGKMGSMIGGFMHDATITWVLVALIAFFYYIVFHALGGQTPGKFALGIRVCRADGRPIGWGTSFLRYVIYWLGSKVLYLGSFWGMFRSDVATWHDLAAGTRVYKVRSLETREESAR